jgi:hypothetical protein
MSIDSTPHQKALFGKLHLTICCLEETHLIERKKHWFKVKGWKIFQANGPPKQARVAMIISNIENFKFTLVNQNKGHFTLTDGAIHQKEITIINLYAPNFIKHTLKNLKAHIDPKTMVVGDFNTPLLPIIGHPNKKIKNKS